MTDNEATKEETITAWVHIYAFVRTAMEAQEPFVKDWMEKNVGTTVKEIHHHLTAQEGLLMAVPNIIDHDGRAWLVYEFVIQAPAGMALLGTATAETLEIPDAWRDGDLQTAIDNELRAAPIPDDASGLEEP